MPSSIPASATIELQAPVLALRGRTPFQAALHRLLANRVARWGMAIILLFALVAVLSPLLLPYDPKTDSDLLARLKPPTLTHPFGTDALGRDILMRIMHGARVSLGLGVGSVWRRLGSAVTVVELLPKMLPHSDGQVADTLLRALKKQGIAFRFESKVTGLARRDGRAAVTVEGPAGSEEISQT